MDTVIEFDVEFCVEMLLNAAHQIQYPILHAKLDIEFDVDYDVEFNTSSTLSVARINRKETKRKKKRKHETESGIHGVSKYLPAKELLFRQLRLAASVAAAPRTFFHKYELLFLFCIATSPNNCLT